MQSEAESITDTYKHIVTVQTWMLHANENLMRRAYLHDLSKLEEPEASGFAAMTADARLKDLTYGTPEYRAMLHEHKPTIQHHYAANDHHPEHFTDGIDGMSLMALLEMLCDWKASTGRMKDGDLLRSIDVNAGRFDYSNQLRRILINTAKELGMLE